MYSKLSQYYDLLQQEVDYLHIADFILQVCKKSLIKPTLLLDAGCGTGSLIAELCRLNVDCVGADGSFEMLTIARKKLGSSTLLLNQFITELDLYGTVNVAVSTLDTLNHLKNIDEVNTAISKISLFLEPGGLFIFDLNSYYKHKYILANNSFIKEYDNLYCVWNNELNEDLSVNISLDFFVRENNSYSRSTEFFKEIFVSDKQINELLSQNNMELLASYDDFSLNQPNYKSQRICYVAKKLSQ